MDDTRGAPIYGTWPADCDNGLQNSGLNTPVPGAVLTVNGKSYIFGEHPTTSISSYVYSFNATSPQTQLFARIYQSRFNFADPSLWGSESAAVNIYLNSIYKCRSWQSAFNYTLVPGKDTYDGLVFAQYSNLNSGAVFVNFNGYINVAPVNVSGPIVPPRSPHVFFFDAANGQTFDVTNTTVPVVVGQPIYLYAIPGGTPAQPKAWNVLGNPIGAYLLIPNISPVPHCAEVTNAAPGCAEIAEPEFTQAFTKFYWTTPGTYSVQYNSVSGVATAAFSVSGPTSVQVNASATGPAKIGPDPITKAPVLFWGNYPTEGGIRISATAVQPAKQSGQFHWLQVITTNSLVHTSFRGVSLDCPLGVGLDNYFFYPAKTTDPGAIKDKSMDDSPYFALDSHDETETRTMQAKTFLMWQPTIQDSIPVALGYTEWIITYGADQVIDPTIQKSQTGRHLALAKFSHL
jgi:hypothetical protein